MLTKEMPREYLNAFELNNNVVQHTSSRGFWAAFGRQVSHSMLVYSPGPSSYSWRARQLFRAGVDVVALTIVRGAGGRVVAIGRAASGPRGFPRWLEALRVSRFDSFIARDSETARQLGLALPVEPDVAFADTYSSEFERRYIAISLRSDTELKPEALEALAAAVRTAGMQPILVSQVARDDVQHRRLAQETSIEAILWDSRSHIEQLARVRGVYAQSRAVVSDRLHALVFGVQYGCCPIALGEGPRGKLRRTLGGVVDYIALRRDMKAVSEVIDQALSSGQADLISRQREEAARRLSLVRSELRSLMVAGQHSGEDRG